MSLKLHPADKNAAAALIIAFFDNLALLVKYPLSGVDTKIRPYASVCLNQGQ